MLSTIIIVLGLVAVVGMFRAMTAEERSVFTKGAVNVAASSSVYMFKASKATVKAAYDCGDIAGMRMSLEGQETINTVDTFNNSIAKEGGAVKVGVRTANRHSDLIGATDAISNLEEYKANLKAELAAARASRS